MDRIREKIVGEHACCAPFLSRYGQPTLHVFEMFPTAASYAEYTAQQEQLRQFLDSENACIHMREIAVATHKSNCGNDNYVHQSVRLSLFAGCDLEPEFMEEILSYA